MRYFFVMNPGSHSGRSGKTFDRLKKLMNDTPITCTFRETAVLDDALQFSREANQQGYDAIIAVGGDGTINGVINGFFDEHGKRVSAARFGVVYTGTSPDFCRSYSIPLSLDEAVNHIIDARTVRIPVGRIRLMKKAHDPSGRFSGERVNYFACCANVGLGASLARRANGGIRKYLGDFAGTLVSLVILLFQFRAGTFVRAIDGREEKVGKMINTSIGLTPFIASGIKMGLDRTAHEGQFYCMTVKELKARHLIPLLKKVYSGKPFANTNYLSVVWGHEIEFENNDQYPEVEFDGDPAGYLPCRITLAEDSLDLIV